jgi:hypothetical protein
MKAYEYIVGKQTQWAMSRGIPLVGSKGLRGRLAYTPQMNQNLFEPLAPDVHECFSRGDGNEINGSPESPAKMQAVHSSSALGVNVFHYWRRLGQVSGIAAACGFCSKGNAISQKIVFEDKYSINHKFRFSPNIDVVFHNAESGRCKRFAVECKFSEPYGSQRHGGLKPEYMAFGKLWADVPGLHALAVSISPDDKKFIYFHAAQLIKHVLGLKNAFGKAGFRLLYLWYDVPGHEGATHRKEIESFSEVTKSDGVKFHSMSYQELILRLADEFRKDHG